MEAIIEAAETERNPVFIITNSQVSETHTISYLGAQVIAVINNAKVPIANHLDHCHEVELCKCAANSRHVSVLIDKSYLSLEENIEATNKVVEYTRAKNVAVEAELG